MSSENDRRRQSVIAETTVLSMVDSWMRQMQRYGKIKIVGHLWIVQGAAGI